MSSLGTKPVCKLSIRLDSQYVDVFTPGRRGGVFGNAQMFVIIFVSLVIVNGGVKPTRQLHEFDGVELPVPDQPSEIVFHRL